MILSKIFSKILRSKATTLSRNFLPLFSAGFLVWILALLLTSCSSIRRVQTIPIETIKEITRTDTLYINNVQYDSIYISQDKFIDRTKDTILIRQHDVEYRYKLLRDTIERIKLEVRHDSIPYEVRITETIEVPRKLTWYDHTARATFWLLIGIIAIYIYLKLKRNRFSFFHCSCPHSSR